MDRIQNGFVVVTSINHPTAAVRGFVEQESWQVIVVGDRKTPSPWKCDPAQFLSPTDQDRSGFYLAQVLPWNHYSRKMIGYLSAIQQGAVTIVDTDDDNNPKSNWHIPDFDGVYSTLPKKSGFINIYKSFTPQHIWPRGFPLDLITHEKTVASNIASTRRRIRVGIWQGLVDGDTDVDAIYRLTVNQPVTFSSREPLVLDEGSLCPFNSQNTAYRKELFPLLYLPACVSFRFTDILRGLVAQPIMWEYDYHLGFTTSTATQIRNPHDYMKDFESEIPCYLYGSKAVEVAQQSLRTGYSLPDNLYQTYEGLVHAGIVPGEEMQVLSAWLRDLEVLAK